MKKGIDYIGVGVGAAILNDEGKILLAKRGANARNEKGLWQIPGGGVEFGEKLEDALKREVKEEHGIEVEVIKLINVANHIIPAEKQHWIAPAFLCKIKSGIPQILEPDKCDEIKWFSFKEASNLPNVAPNSQEAIKILQRK
jgi:8-oxo-dGTP diphosphatase